MTAKSLSLMAGVALATSLDGRCTLISLIPSSSKQLFSTKSRVAKSLVLTPPTHLATRPGQLFCGDLANDLAVVGGEGGLWQTRLKEPISLAPIEAVTSSRLCKLSANSAMVATIPTCSSVVSLISLKTGQELGRLDATNHYILDLGLTDQDQLLTATTDLSLNVYDLHDLDHAWQQVSDLPWLPAWLKVDSDTCLLSSIDCQRSNELVIFDFWQRGRKKGSSLSSSSAAVDDARGEFESGLLFYRYR